jgi:hypothetical protein
MRHTMRVRSRGWIVAAVVLPLAIVVTSGPAAHGGGRSGSVGGGSVGHSSGGIGAVGGRAAMPAIAPRQITGVGNGAGKPLNLTPPNISGPKIMQFKPSGNQNRGYTGNGGVIVQSMLCPTCGSVITNRLGVATPNCPRCGAPLQPLPAGNAGVGGVPAGQGQGVADSSPLEEATPSGRDDGSLEAATLSTPNRRFDSDAQAEATNERTSSTPADVETMKLVAAGMALMTTGLFACCLFTRRLG